jgi:hypothetical protein
MKNLLLIFSAFNFLINVSCAQNAKRINACLCLISETDSAANLTFGLFKGKATSKYISNKFNPVFIPKNDSIKCKMVKFDFYNALFIPLFISPFETYVSNQKLRGQKINETAILQADSIFESEFNLTGLVHSNYFSSPGFYYKCRKVKIEFIEIQQPDFNTENQLNNLKTLKHKEWGVTTRLEILKTL